MVAPRIEKESNKKNQRLIDWKKVAYSTSVSSIRAVFRRNKEDLESLVELRAGQRDDALVEKDAE